MVKKEKINFWMTQKRLDELRVLSRELDIPVSILLRMGAGLIIQKHKKTLIEAMQSESK